ncbi:MULTISPECIES: CYTH domain-containing protein [Calothrix]|uniref:CYTH domain-containing protein n=2 Tax=Calothrix TaxID=1186 RepID=A0ABR8AA94_9CYAN|nr:MULTISPECIES: CYTH domain-containing protein [Calothrix]MBD2196579.1 CYTH domain-containing protein [Calothrix parietina FACHB-288]MBD2228056.1 CYTH domain-containing protein [Calothrix anomala FACHB-343]
MAAEIERKFLIKGDRWRQLAEGSRYVQGYILTAKQATVRVRIVGNQGYLTIKGATVQYSRSEFEYPIPVEDAQEMLDTLCDRPLIEKTRYKIAYSNLIWEIDEFEGVNKGLIIAEVELTDEKQQIELPDWIGEEVSDNPKYFNSNLVKHPFSQW